MIQVLHWSWDSPLKDGWVYKTPEEIHQETALTLEQQIAVKKSLRKKGILLESEKATHCIHYKINTKVLDDVWEKSRGRTFSGTEVEIGEL